MDGAWHSTKLVQKDVLDLSFAVWSHNVLQYIYCSLMMPEKREYFTPLFIHFKLHSEICAARIYTDLEYYHLSDIVGVCCCWIFFYQIGRAFDR